MQITNFYSKSTFKILFIICVVAALGNLLLSVTGTHFLPLFIHLILAILFSGAAVYILLKNYFVKYDSFADAVIIERPSLFSFGSKPKPQLMNRFMKHDLREYNVENKWYGSVLQLKYETTSGNIEEIRIPFRFFGVRRAAVLQKDLKRILNTDFHMFIGSGFHIPQPPK